MENYDDDYAEQIVQAIVPILQAREEQLIVKVKDIITEINNEQENKIRDLLDTQQREREQWERERERFKEDLRRELREDLKNTIRKGTFSFKEEVETDGFSSGHVGDGNFHTLFLFDPQIPEEVQFVEDMAQNIALISLELDGTCTGEHGIGIEKRELLVKEVDESGLTVMKELKQALDPNGIMNPGKVFY